jgi:ABC-2 type transport system permease protein
MIRFVMAMLDALKALFADKGARMTMVVSIVIYACIYPLPYSGEVVRDIPVAVIDQDGTVASRELLRRLDNADSVAVAAVVDGLSQAQQLFFERQVYGVVLVPPNFERDLLHGRQAPVAAFGDGSYFIIYNGIATAASNAARSLGAEVRAARLTALGLDEATVSTLVRPVTVASVPLFNPGGGYASYIVPAAFVLIIQQTLLMGIGIMHAGRPMPRGAQALAAPAAYVMLYVFWVAVTQLLLPLIYGLPHLGTPLVLFALAVPFLLAVTAFGFALIQVVPLREGVIFFLVVQGMPLFFMTGVAWPIESVAEPIRTIAMAIPSTSAIFAMIQVDQMGASLNQVLPTIHLQLALTLAYGALAWVLHRWRFGQNTGTWSGSGDRVG